MAGYPEWKLDETKRYSPSEAKVVGHELEVDRKRWKEREQKAVRVETRLTLESPARAELVAASFFRDSNAAWKFMLANPAGKTVPCLVSPSGDAVAWDQFWSSARWWSPLIGSVLLLIGLWQLARSPMLRISAVTTATLFCAVFFLMGIGSALQIWPAAMTQVKAGGWDLVPCNSVESRSVSSGKSSKTQISFRYTYQGRDYLAVKNANSFDFGHIDTMPSACRVDPEAPWQVALTWGWRPSLGVVLFPVPFLALGVFALIIPFSPRLQRLVWESRSHETGRRFHIRADRMTGIAGRLFALVFAGSIVGVFASVCAEMWMANHDHKWLLTIFLVPFVMAVLFLAKGLVTKVWESQRS